MVELLPIKQIVGVQFLAFTQAKVLARRRLESSLILSLREDRISEAAS